MKYDRSNEQLAHAQLELVGGQLAQQAVTPTIQAEVTNAEDGV